MKPSSKPEVVVVTGASAGLGRAIVREIARGGQRRFAPRSDANVWKKQ
jgi:NAD(P)-dependent dehydrogenase (short-subunit alcohol dehydrogenase family)